ncbi:MAG: 3'(2'),5'-bisphosphate nucleotidase CysQ [Luteitalea sp.]|nr:3'(2'),5'-bisphosphate nucleotidase CysQ [Luteitalea sp.]
MGTARGRRPARMSPRIDVMHDNSFRDLVPAVIEAAAAAGRCIEGVRAEGLGVATKSDLSPVTRADHEADALLRERLLALVPAGWLSEETADAPERLAQQLLWVVDPLDGTKEFIGGIPEYAVAIALVEEAQPVLSLVHNPARGDTYWAVRDHGAFLTQVHTADASQDHQRIRAAEGRNLLASRSECRSGEFAPFEAAWQITSMGSIAYKLAQVACGSAAVTFSRGPKHEWDVCAGALLVSEAGGRVSDVFGAPLQFNQPFPKVKGILAGAPHAYANALQELAQIGASARMNELTDPPASLQRS